MNIFQVYKIILGLIVAAFVVTFLITFMGDYLGLNTQTMTYKAMNSFRNVVQDVYSTGNFVEFNQLSQRGMPECSVRPADEIVPMHIKCGSIGMSFFTPLIFTEERGRELLIERTHLDYGWTKFYTVLALPVGTETNEIINTLEENLLASSTTFKNQLLVQAAIEEQKLSMLEAEKNKILAAIDEIQSSVGECGSLYNSLKIQLNSNDFQNAENIYSEQIKDDTDDITCPVISSEAEMTLKCINIGNEFKDFLEDIRLSVNNPSVLKSALGNAKVFYVENMVIAGCY